MPDEIPSEIPAVPEPAWPAMDAPERELLEGFLDGYRTVLLRKAAGLGQGELSTPLAPSDMTLGGLLKHMAYVEDNWFTQVMLGEPPPEPWASVDWDADHDWEWHTAADDAPDALANLYETAVDRSRAVARRFERLDALAARPSRDGTASLRWIYVHMIEEYARHCGHADVIRESIDGATGD
jgi:uncharacterized damage-inducible protein DinB